FFFFTHPPAPITHTLSLHDALPICDAVPAAAHATPGAAGRDEHIADAGEAATGHRRTRGRRRPACRSRRSCRHGARRRRPRRERSEEHTSELQSPYDLVCRLLLEKK